MKVITQNRFSGLDEQIKTHEGFPSVTEGWNFRIDNGGNIVKRNVIKEVFRLQEQKIDAIWCGSIFGEETVIIASNGRIYRCPAHTVPAAPTEIGQIESTESCLIFDFNGVIYIKTHSYYGKYDGNALSEVEGYIPCVAMSCAPNGEGVAYEQINLLSNKRRQLFSGDDTAVLYRLAENEIDRIISVKIDGNDYQYHYDLINGGSAISFEMPPEAGLNNVEVIYEKALSDSDRARFFGCDMMMLFGGNSDGRIFMWSNEDYPNYRFHSELADGIPSAEYFPVNGFTIIGNSKITSIAQQYNRQLIFTENEAFYSVCQLKEDSLGNVYSSFPVYSLNGSKGCLIKTKGCIIDNRPITLCHDGLNAWESTAVENEKNAICISNPVRDTMCLCLKSKTAKHILDFQANRELFFIDGPYVLVYNYGNGAWYKYNGFGGENYCIIGKSLYFSQGGALFLFDNQADSEKYYMEVSTPYLRLGSDYGRCDINEMGIFMSVRGDVTLAVSFFGEDGLPAMERKYSFNHSERKYFRMSLRPNIKRCMPVSFKLESGGRGDCSIHSITSRM